MISKKILILISTYNGEDYIQAQIDSILEQKTEMMVDILVRDDGSQDSTVMKIEEMMKNEPRVSLLQGKNLGYVGSFFELLNCVHGYDYYGLCDQDDIWKNEKIQTAIEQIEVVGEGPVLYGSSSSLVYEDMIPFGITQINLKGITLFNTLIQNILPGHTQVMNQEMLEIIQSCEIDAKRIYVHDAWITNLAMLKGKIVFDNEPHTLYRQHKKNQIGFGEGTIGWVKERIKRVRKSDSKKYATQIHYFWECYGNQLELNEKIELENFIFCQKSIITRIMYILKSELYRQRSYETWLFKLLYIMGGYKISD